MKTDTKRALGSLAKATGLPGDTIMAMALSEWESKHCSHSTLAGQALAMQDMTRLVDLAGESLALTKEIKNLIHDRKAL